MGNARAAYVLAAYVLLAGASDVAAAPIAADGYEVALFATGIGATAGMRAGADGKIYVADYGGGRVLSIDALGTKSVLASGVAFVTDVALTDSGRLFATSSTGGNSAVVEIVAGSASDFAKGFSFPTSVAARGDFLYVANSGAGTIARLGLDGAADTFLSGANAPNGPYGLSFDGAGNLYYLDHFTGGVYRYASGGVPVQVGAASPLGGTFTGLGFDGDLFFSDVNAGVLYRVGSDGSQRLFATGFAAKGTPPVIGPQGIAYFGGDDLFVADGDAIWRISRPTPVPEPETLGMLLVALVTAAARRWRT